MADESAGAHHGSEPPVAADRPFVDGTTTSAEELRAEVDAHSGPVDAAVNGHVQEMRADVGETLAELTARLDASVTASRSAAVTIGRAGAAVAAALLLLLVVRRRRARRRLG